MAKAPQLNTKTVSEVRKSRVSFSSKLDTGELIAASSNITVTIVQGTTALIVSTVAVSTSALTVNGSTHVAGQVATFIVSAGLANTRYELSVVAVTDAGQTVSTICPLFVEASS